MTGTVHHGPYHASWPVPYSMARTVHHGPYHTCCPHVAGGPCITVLLFPGLMMMMMGIWLVETGGCIVEYEYDCIYGNNNFIIEDYY